MREHFNHNPQNSNEMLMDTVTGYNQQSCG
jgi:hypothetical protein